MALKTFTTADGSANQALVTNGSGVLSFAAVGASAGQVIQVVTATDSTERTSTSTSFVTASNTLSVSITPSSASNKVFITAGLSVGTPDVNNRTMFFTIYRGATDLGAASDKGLAVYYGGYVLDMFSPVVGMPVSILDSPNTTSAITYQVYFRVGSGTGYINYVNTKASITAFEIKG